MGAAEDIRVQIPTELSIACEMAQALNGLIEPNKKGKNSAQDFVLWVPLRVEVKCDYKAKETRNLYFEVFNSYRKQPSGLAATKAWRWAHYTPGDGGFYAYNPALMLRWLKTESGQVLLKDNGDKNSDGYVIPIVTVSKLPFVKWYPFIA